MLEEGITEEQKEIEIKKFRIEFIAKTLCGMQTFSDSPLPSLQPTPISSAKSGAKPSSRDADKEK